METIGQDNDTNNEQFETSSLSHVPTMSKQKMDEEDNRKISETRKYSKAEKKSDQIGKEDPPDIYWDGHIGVPLFAL